MAKRGENIYHRRDGRWEGRYIKGRKPNGKPRFGSVYGRSYGEVKIRLIPLKAASQEAPEGRFTGPFRDYLLLRLAEQQVSQIKPSSYNSYFCIVHNHLIPGLGGILTHRLTMQHVQQFLCKLNKMSLSDGTVRNIFRYLSGAVRAAVKSRLMARDICEGIALPKTKRKEVHALSQSEQVRLERTAINAVCDKNQGIEVILALNTGMRIGEICALRWSDVDFENEIINVRQTIQRLRTQGHDSKTMLNIGSPKSVSSQRKIPMNAELSRLLRMLKTCSTGDYVVRSRGDFAEPRVVQYRFQQLLKRANVPHVGFHTLRHSFATRCMELGVDVATISKLLGHSSIKLTLDTYTDSMFEQRRAAVQMLSQLAAA